MEGDFRFHSYSFDKLKELLVSGDGAGSSTLLDLKSHLGYFRDYFDPSGVGAKVIIEEARYTDRDYLDDYAEYYVRCHGDKYSKHCRRLHFFNNEFTEKDFFGLLRRESLKLSEEILNEAYLGFIIIKPLPSTIIGKTCLKTYLADSATGREYPTVRNYRVNLAGLNLSINTLCFQEQDSVLAACATSALWSVFHRTGVVFQHAIPTPAEITKVATKAFPLESRSLPNSGLNAIQMAAAIRSLGLEPLYLEVPNNFAFKTFVYGYLKAGIPVLMGCELVDTDGGKLQKLGRHAVAITGFRSEANPTAAMPQDSFSANKICKIYAHDDQVGPFSRMELDGFPLTLSAIRGPSDGLSLTTSWLNDSGKRGTVRAIPVILLIPLYHKIRILSDSVYGVVYAFARVIRALDKMAAPAPPLLHDFEWDIHLTSVGDIKNAVHSHNLLAGTRLSNFLTESMPRWLWRATILENGNRAMDLLFDATDIEQGDFFLRAVEYNEDLASRIRELVANDFISKFEKILNTLNLKDRCRAKKARPIFQWFIGPSAN